MEDPRNIITEKENRPAQSLESRRAFMRLPLEERRQLLGKQAKEMLVHYQQNTEWQELEMGDLVNY